MKSVDVKFDEYQGQMSSNYDDYPIYEEKEEEKSSPISSKSSPSVSPQTSSPSSCKGTP